MQNNKSKNEGWADDISKYKAKTHYYKDGVSLCGKAIEKPYMRNFNKEKFASKYSCDCVLCIKKLKGIS